jgi:hypothetical protein
MKNVFPVLVAVAAAFAAFAFRTEGPATPATNVTYWFPTDEEGNVTDFEIPTSATTNPCPDGGEEYCALGYDEESPLITEDGGMVTLHDLTPLANGIPAKREP